MSQEIQNNKGQVFIKSTGVVKSYSKEHGYGFIFSIDEPDRDIYVHFTSIIMEGKKELNVGDNVDFLYKDFGDKGLRAYQVKKV